MEYGVFVEDFKRQADKPIWIAKPTGRAQGRGIFLFTDLREVKIWKKASENRGKPKDDDEDDVENYVVQRYITNPYLVGGKKFDLRIYVLVTSFMPLTIWLYRGGFGRFSAFRYHADAKASSLRLKKSSAVSISCASRYSTSSASFGVEGFIVRRRASATSSATLAMAGMVCAIRDRDRL